MAVAALAWLTGPAQADQVKGAQKLMKIQNVEDLQKIDVGDVIVMSCPMCKDTYAEVVTKGTHAVEREELKTVGIHLCSNCDTKLVTKGQGKEAKDVLVHTCKKCGSEDVTCCVLKKGTFPASGMEDDKK
jgi:hypothetical protein